MYRNIIQGPSTSRQSLKETSFATKIKITEDPYLDVEWTWEKPSGSAFVNLSNYDKDVQFHKNFSSGTAVVRSTQPMSHDQFFWELKMISPVYGTDMMVGVGTTEADISQVQDRFISLLGSTQQSWGLSYTGLFHHNGVARGFSGRFGQGTIIGVHLDLWNGTISFYKNKKYLGIAGRGLTGKTLYAMASSTAACSGMRIIRSCSFPSSLQYLCCAKLRQLIPDDKHVLRVIPIPPGLCQYINKNLGWLMEPRLMECSQQPIMSLRDGLLAAMKSESSDPVMSSVVRTDETECEESDGSFGEVRGEMVMLGSRPAILRGPQRRRPRDMFSRPRGESRLESIVMQEMPDFRDSPYLHDEPMNVRGSAYLHEPVCLPESLYFPESMNLRDSAMLCDLSSLPADVDRTFEMFGVDEEQGVEPMSGERAAKRMRTSSYNYIMGLSDNE